MRCDLQNKAVTVIGLSRSGFSAARLLQRVGAKVRVSELRDEPESRALIQRLKPSEAEVGRHTENFIAHSDLIVVSPGVPPDAKPFQWAAQNRIPVISEIELGYMFCRAPIVAVTGTNGKSTTVSLIHEIVLKNGVRSVLLGTRPTGRHNSSTGSQFFST